MLFVRTSVTWYCLFYIHDIYSECVMYSGLCYLLRCVSLCINFWATLSHLSLTWMLTFSLTFIFNSIALDLCFINQRFFITYLHSTHLSFPNMTANLFINLFIFYSIPLDLCSINQLFFPLTLSFPKMTAIFLSIF